MERYKATLFLLACTFLSFGYSVKLNISETGCEVRGIRSLICKVLPKKVPRGIEEVVSQYTCHQSGIIDLETFKDVSWKQVKVLQIEDNEYVNKTDVHSIIEIKSHGFSALINLEELHLNSLYLKKMERYSLKGLHSLRLLDLDRCPWLSFDQSVLPMLAESTELQELQEVSMRSINTFTDERAFSLNSSFFNTTMFKQIQRFHAGENTIDQLDLSSLQRNSACDYLQEVDLSKSKIEAMNDILLWKPICPNILNFNLHSAILPDRAVRFFDEGFIPKEVSVNSSNFLTFIYSIEAIDLTGILPDENKGFLKNGTILRLSETTDWKLRKVNIGHNYLKIVNLTILCKGILIDELNITGNEIEFINPNSISCLTSMKILDLSHNRLGTMERNYPDLFKELLLPFDALTYLDLRHNYLTYIPEDFLQANPKLEFLDLSYNELKSVSFNIGRLKDIKLLILRRNRIVLLENSFMKSYQALFENRKNHSEIINSLILKENSFSCSTCESYETIKWIVESPAVDIEKQSLICTDDVNHIVEIDDNIVADLNGICEKPKRVRTIAISVTVIPLVCLLTFLFIMYIRWTHIGKETLEENIRLIHDNHHGDNSLVFFGYSSEDDAFARRYVFGPLNENLRRKLNRQNLVCDGDTCFRLGTPIVHEMHRNLNKCPVVLFLVSRAFCRSANCRDELQFAHSMNKPIVLMFKEHVPEYVMTPVMRVLFKRFTRLSWKMENGEPKLSTSWDHLCRCLITLAGNEDGVLVQVSFKKYLSNFISRCLRSIRCANS